MSTTDEPVSFRRAEAADTRSVTRLLLGIYGEREYFVGDGPAPERNLALRIETDDTHRTLYLVATAARSCDAEPGGEVVGWLELHRSPARRLEHVALLTLAVAPRCRRRGVAGSLLRFSYDWCKAEGVVKVSLHVRAGNDAAIALYEREGFELEGRERGQIRLEPGASGDERYEDNLIMGKWL